jgi:hypothetical protein
MDAQPLLRSLIVPALLVGLALPGAACGGSVVKDDDDGASGSGGSGAGPVTTTAASAGGDGPSSATAASGAGSTGSTGAVASGAGGGAACDDHDDCPGGVCDFGADACIEACGGDGTCGPGLVCDGCATSSCGPCDDCVAGCVLAPPHSCDDHDDCAASDVCVYALGGCYPSCGEPAGCGDGFVCDDCATSSCPGCRDCRAACVPAL